MDLKQTGSSGGRVRLKPRAQLWVKLGIGAEEGSECRLRFIVNSSFRRTRFQTPVIWVAGGRCNRETTSSINAGVTRWPLGWLSVRFPWCSEFPTCYFYVSVGSLQALWPSTPPKTAKKDFLWRKQGILHWIHLQYFPPLLHNRGRNHRRLHKTTLSQYWTRSAVLIYCHFLSIASQVRAIFATSTKFPESRTFPVLTPLAVLSSRRRSLEVKARIDLFILLFIKKLLRCIQHLLGI